MSLCIVFNRRVYSITLYRLGKEKPRAPCGDPVGRPLLPRLARWKKALAECLRTYEKRVRGETQDADCKCGVRLGNISKRK